MKSITPDERDGIPREVATAMLTEPKARLSGTMRRNLRDARARYFTSAVPLRIHHDGKLYDDAYPAKPSDPARKIDTYSLEQMLRWQRRCVARRRGLQAQYQKLVGQPPFADKRAEAARLRAMAVLEQAVASLDAMRDNLEDEVALRLAVVPEPGIPSRKHIDPQVRRKQQLLAMTEIIFGEPERKDFIGGRVISRAQAHDFSDCDTSVPTAAEIQE